jgi:hypothetical protein
MEITFLLCVYRHSGDPKNPSAPVCAKGCAVINTTAGEKVSKDRAAVRAEQTKGRTRRPFADELIG